MVGSGPGRARTDSELLRVAQFGLRWFGFLVMFSYGLGNNKIGQGMAMIGLGWVGAGQEWLGSVLFRMARNGQGWSTSALWGWELVWHGLVWC